MPISRRHLLTTTALSAAAVAASLAVPGSRALLAQTRPRNAGIYRFKLGDFNLISISDGTLTVPAAVFAANASPEQLQEVLKQSFLSSTLTADCNILLVDTGRQKVLIDTGSGGLNGATAGKLVENLQQAQIQPSDITAIVLTHAHGDHIGGLRGTNGTTFPNARYFINKREWDFWTSDRPDLPNFRGPAEMKQQMLNLAKTQLSTIRERVTTIQPNQEFLPGIQAMPAYGHTPGHIAVRIASGDVALVHVADTVHINSINLWHPSWTPIFDGDQALAAQTRQAVLAKIAADRTLMFAYHFPYPGIGYLRSRPQEGFDWQPVPWQFAV